MGRKFKDLTGQRFGRLIAVKYLGNGKWLCQCDCGNSKIVNSGDLNSSRVNSCGCYKSEYITKKNKIHGLRQHRLYSIYYGMINRCYNESVESYNYYGGRGIKVCDEWLDKENGFINFYNWAIENGYDDSLTIDRIDVNGNYEPNNCRWATSTIQAFNKNNTVFVTFDNERKTLVEWCNLYNINIKTVRDRVKREWDIIKAIRTPVNSKYRRKEYNDGINLL
jgi:hypothetical protein